MLRRSVILLAFLAVAGGCGGPASGLEANGDSSVDAAAPGNDSPAGCPEGADGPGWISGTISGDLHGAVEVSFIRNIEPVSSDGTVPSLGESVVPDASGRYSFHAVGGVTYRISPRSLDPNHWYFTFTPAYRVVTASNVTCVANQDFRAEAAQVYEFSGTIAAEGPMQLGPLNFFMNAEAGGAIVSNANTVMFPDGSVARSLPLGPYTMHGLAGTYTISAPAEIQLPPLSGYSLKPLMRTVVLGGTPVPLTGQDFTMSPDGHVLSGTVGGYPANSAPYYYTVLLSDGRGQVPDVHGNYAFGAVADGPHTVSMLARPEVTFTPASRDVTVSGGDVAGQDFVASLNTNTLSGSLPGCGSNQVFVFLSADAWTTLTYNWQAPDAYQLEHVGNGTFMLMPSLSSSSITGSFDPPSRMVDVAGASVAGQDFICLP